MEIMILRYYFIIFFIFFKAKVFAQILDSLNLPKKTENYFSLNYDNDFFSATDRYYTQGILITFIHTVVKRSPFSYALLKLKKGTLNYYGIHAEQDVFTPRSIRYKEGEIYYGERPFTAVFFISHSLASINTEKKLLLVTQLDLGIIGPWAKGEEEQKGIHKALNNIQPQGWQNQLSNDYIINYRAKIEKGLVLTKHYELMSSLSARLGTLYTDLSVGALMRFGILNPYFSSLGLNKNSGHKFNVYVTGRVNGKIVGHNATLQGGLTNSGNIYELPASSIKRFVAELSAGVLLAYKRISLEYGKTYITPEFNGGLDHGWGKCVITVCF